MAKTVRLSYEYGETIPTAPFATTRISASETIELEEGDDRELQFQLMVGRVLADIAVQKGQILAAIDKRNQQ